MASFLVIGAAMLTLVTAVAQGSPRVSLAVGGLTIVAALATGRVLWEWQSLLVTLVAVILFIPIRRYGVPVRLPFELEPYRIVVAFIATGWLTSLLIDPRVRVRRTGFEAPLGLLLVAVLGSEVANPGRVTAFSSLVVKKLTFLASFAIIFYVIVSVGRSRAAIELIVKTLVGGAAAVAACAVYESRTGYNVFDHLSGILPFLEHNVVASFGDRGARLRVYASAQHPIALGAALVMAIPFAYYLVQSTGRRRWWAAMILLAVGALATVSRTSIVMLLVIVVVYAWLRRREVKRLWPLIVPLLLAVHLALPGTIGSITAAFAPSGGLIAEQSSSAGGRGSGRLADLAPTLSQASHRPVFGLGYGTRNTDAGKEDALLILDDEWLGVLLETGIVGVIAWGWLFIRGVRRCGRAAKNDRTPRGWLLAAVAASMASYAIGMFFYDAFAFIQVTFLAFIVLALGSALLTPSARELVSLGWTETATATD